MAVDNNDGPPGLSLFLLSSRFSITWEAWSSRIEGALTGWQWEAWSGQTGSLIMHGSGRPGAAEW